MTTMFAGMPIDTWRTKAPSIFAQLPDTFFAPLAQVLVAWGNFELHLDEFIDGMVRTSKFETHHPRWRRQPFKDRIRLCADVMKVCFQGHSNPDHARHAAFLHARPSRVLHAHAIDPSGLDRCASTRCATRVGLICVIGGASGPMAPRLKGRTASGPVRRCGTARPPGNSSAVECGCARHVRSRGRRS
jgi:hypothetical protein